MLVCACNFVKEAELRSAIRAGADSLAALRACMAVCDTCTACQARILQLLAEEAGATDDDRA